MNQLFRCCFLLLFMSALDVTMAQPPNDRELDSLADAVHRARDPQKKADAMLNLANRLPQSAYGDAMAHIREACAIFRDQSDAKGLIRAHLLLGDIHFKQHQLAEALHYDSIGIHLADSIGDLEGKVRLLSNQARDFSMSGNAVKADQAAQEALAIETGLPKPNIRRLVSLYNLLGIVNRSMGNLQQSLAYFDQGLAYRDSLTPHRAEDRVLVNLYMNKGTTLTKLQRFPEAVEVHLEAIKIKESFGDSVGLVQSFNNLAVVFRNAAETEKALEYYNKALAISKATNQSFSVGNTLVNIANLYFEGDKRDTAYAYYEQAIESFDAISSKPGLWLAYHNYGNTLRKAGDLPRSKQHLELALDHALSGGGTERINSTKAVLGRVYFEQGDWRKAEMLYEEALGQTDTSVHTDNLMTLYLYLRDLNEKKGDYRAAYRYQALYTGLQQERLTENERIAVLKAENQYQLEKKDLLLAMQQQEAKQRRTVLLMIAATAIVVLLAVLSLLIFRRRRLRERHAAQLNHLAQQHQIDTTRALRSAEEEERKKIAGKLHDEVGALLSVTRLNVDQLHGDVFAADSDAALKLQTTQKLLGEISETVRNISHSLMPIALEKYGLKAAISDLVTAVNTSGRIHVEEVIEGLADSHRWGHDFCLSVYRIVQEVVNNVIKHAGASHLLVQIVELDGSVTLYMEDNGKGLKDAGVSGGVGLQLLRSNIAYLNGKIEVNGRENEGTFVLVELPLPTESIAP